MADSGDEADSRTASVGIQRPRSKNSSNRGSGDNDSRPKKRQRRNRSRASDVSDTLPRGASFSSSPLEIDPDETSSSGSSAESGSNSDSDSPEKPAPVNPHAGSTAPAISWNQGRKAPVRTTLGKRKASGEVRPKAQATKPESEQFTTVNAFWKSRDGSASPEPTDVAGKQKVQDKLDESSDLEEGEVDSRSDSDAVSLDSEADDSILLNIDPKAEGGAVEDSNQEDMAVTNGHTNGAVNGVSGGSSESKEAAFELYAKKYPTTPATLVDLDKKDMEIQAQFIYWDRDINDIDLQLPVGCTECLQYGHQAAVCPTKECVHCKAWNEHISTQCPSWRRCQRCRERGHTDKECSSPLKSSASEVPCDLCGSSEHLESSCDWQWKFPLRETSSTEVRVSISCANCCSGSHLIGDCPSLRRPLNTTCFTLKGIDPDIIVNLNTAPKEAPPPINYKQGRRGRGGARGGINTRSSSPSSDDLLPRKGTKPQPISRGRGRGSHIRFNTGPPPPRNGPGPDKSRGRPPPTRGRPQFPGNNTRQRTLSPLPRQNFPRGPPPRGRGRGGNGRGGPPSRGGFRGRRGK
ncbi:hypothetical protein N7466_005082 [Penicillium verhagenii]|uniref:uncharacterized protein n=1 Tax=Penicillium verhagenii TaxID=1562060 RepID=UPI0025457A70|nr:uncharacterized protein N7466_005082 [Penicillium verhagenii]KAJ5935535.1 hypothetical protein N7466_005082 [Penicillium verhagenii]